MARRIDNDKILEIQKATDIVALVSEYTSLKKTGRNYQGLCPFHAEKTPSFSVSQDKQVYHCFGCKAGGNIFRFLMDKEGISFQEAVETLAERQGVKMEWKNTPDEGARRRSLEIMEWAAGLYQEQLTSDSGAAALKYILGRGFTPETVKNFRLGWAPDRWDFLLGRARSRKYEEKELLEVGLIHPRSQGEGNYDYFRDRLLFPICDPRGKVVGFGGRVLPSAEGPKYLNSPETRLFNKSRLLYGFDRGRAAAREVNTVGVMEGYTDVMMAHQQGMEWMVAPLGTALTPEHLGLLKRAGDKIFLVFDGDDAGVHAAVRGTGLFLEEDLDGFIVLLPPQDDPCSFLAREGKAAFSRKIAEGEDLLTFLLGWLGRQYDLDRPDGKNRAAEELLKLLSRMPNPVRRELYLQQAAERWGLPLEVLKEGLQRILAGERRPPGPRPALPAPGNPAAAGAPSDTPLGRQLIEALLARPELVARLEGREPALPGDGVAGEVLAAMTRLGQERKRVDVQELLLELKDAVPSSWVVARLEAILPDTDYEKIFSDCLERGRRDRERQRLAALKERLRQAEQQGRTDEVRTLLQELGGHYGGKR